MVSTPEGAPSPTVQSPGVSAEAGAVLPGAQPVAPLAAVADVNTQLRWLVEKGHVIEFSDGRLAVPSAAVSRVQMAHPHGNTRRDHRSEPRGDRKRTDAAAAK